MSLVDTVTETVEPVVDALGVELVDVEHRGGVVRVVVDEQGGIGLDRLAAVTQAVSRALDEADPVPGHYTLEVSSPGLERPLRTPQHFARAVGQKVNVKTTPAFEGERRLSGVLLDATDGRITVETEAAGRVVVPMTAVERARTVFEWGPGPKPGKGSKPGAAKRSALPAGTATAPGGAGAGRSDTGRRRADEAAPGDELVGGTATVDER